MSGKSDKKKPLVPSLRFPEFREAGAWEVKRLGELSEIVRGGSPRPITDYITTDSEGLNWLKIGDVHQNEKYVTSTEEKVKKSAISKTREVYPGDLIMSNSMSFGRPYILKIKTCIHDGWIAVTDINNEVERDYLYYFILSSSSQFYFRNAAAGGGVKNLNADIVKLLSVSLPHYLEQQKIAHCLSSLDEVIGLQAKKVQALKQHKKGLMQQLFPAEGETTPRLRFPEFREAGAWDKQRIGDLLSLEYGAPLPEGSRLEGDIPVIGSNGVVGYHSEPLIKGPAIVIGRKGSAGQVSWIDSPCYPIDTTFFVDLSRKDCQLRFIYLLLEHHRLQELVREGGVPGLNRDDVYAVKATISKHTEQQKIAHCLSSLDEVIGLESHKLDALKNLKKGLMQQLFPQEVA